MQDFDSQHLGAPQCPALLLSREQGIEEWLSALPHSSLEHPNLGLLGLSFSLKPEMATLTYTQAMDKESFLLHGRRGQSTLLRDSRRSLKPQQTLGKCPWGATVEGGLPPHSSPDLESRTEWAEKNQGTRGSEPLSGRGHTIRVSATIPGPAPPRPSTCPYNRSMSTEPCPCALRPDVTHVRTLRRRRSEGPLYRPKTHPEGEV